MSSTAWPTRCPPDPGPALRSQHTEGRQKASGSSLNASGSPQGRSSLWEVRLSDLQRLRVLRFMDVQMSDYRHRWLYLSGVVMSWLTVNSNAMRRELFELAREAGGWSEEHAAGKLSSVIRRTFGAFGGGKVEYQGRQVDPRYRFTNQRIIEELEIDRKQYLTRAAKRRAKARRLAR